jgi:hypothetical protein
MPADAILTSIHDSSKKEWPLGQSYVVSSTELSFRTNLRPTGPARKASSCSMPSSSMIVVS